MQKGTIDEYHSMKICMSRGNIHHDIGGNVAEQLTRTTPKRTVSHHHRLSRGPARHHRATRTGQTPARHPAHRLGQVTLLPDGKSLLPTSHHRLLSLESVNARPVPALQQSL